jgi:glycosyltransferase involved in cell wall biosynthesis
VVEPGDPAGFCAAASRLIESPGLRDELGRAARRYAEAHFDIGRIGDAFECLLSGSTPPSACPARC